MERISKCVNIGHPGDMMYIDESFQTNCVKRMNYELDLQSIIM